MISHHPYERGESGCAVCGKSRLSAYHFTEQEGKGTPPPHARKCWGNTMQAAIKPRSRWVYR